MWYSISVLGTFALRLVMNENIIPENPEGAANQETSDSIPFFPGLDGTEAEYKDNKKPESDKPQAHVTPPTGRQKFWKIIRKMSIADWIIAAATTAIAVTGYYQWQAISGQLDVMKQSEQPYVTIEGLVPQDFPDGQLPGFVFVFKNYGRNVATHIFGNTTFSITPNDLGPIEIKIGMVSSNLTQEFALYPRVGNPIFADAGGDFSLIDIPGNATMNRWIAASGTQEWKEHKGAVKAGTEHVYLWGFIGYKDSEGKQMPLEKFCFTYNQQLGRPSVLGPFDACKKTYASQ